MIPVIIFGLVFQSSLVNSAGSSDTTQQYMLSLPLHVSKIDNDDVNLKDKIDRMEENIANILAILNNTTTTDTNKQPRRECQQSPLLHSCDEVKSTWPDSVSDYYLIADNTGHARHVYCNMENTCGDKEGGWMRVGYLNMSDPSVQCPPGFRLYEENGIRACGRQSSGCQSVEFPSHNIKYSQVCGRVTGYEKGSPSAIDRRHKDINGPYVDGVSITRGTSRHHIWTFMAGLQKDKVPSHLQWLCPCSPGSTVTPQSFIGNDYFCEAGSSSRWDLSTFHTEPLWDGKQCGLIEEACCNVTGIPWFNKVLEQPTTDYIELRVCADQHINDEDAPVGYYDIYIK